MMDTQADYFTPYTYMQVNDVNMHKHIHACTCALRTYTANSFAGENFTKPSYPFIVAETLRGIYYHQYGTVLGFHM